MPDQPAPKTLHQQSVDYTVQAVAQREARLAAQDLLILDLRCQLAAAHARIAELEVVALTDALAKAAAETHTALDKVAEAKTARRAR